MEENTRDDASGLSETSDTSDTSETSDTSDTRAGKLAVDALSIDLITMNVLTSLRGHYRYKAVYSFMALGLLSKKDADDLFLQPAEIQYGPGGLKTLMQTCSAVLKLIRYEHGWLFCERSEDVLRNSVLDPRNAWVMLMQVVQIGLDASIINAMICTYKIDVTVSIPYRLARAGVDLPSTLRPDVSIIDYAVIIGDFKVADVLIHHGATLTVAVLCHMSMVETPKLHPFDDERVMYDRVVDYLISRGVSLDAPMGGDSPVADANVLGFVAYCSARCTETSPLLVARAALARGADVNAPGCHGLPAVLWAIRYWNLQLSKLLLEHGAVIPRTISPDGIATIPSSHIIYSELTTPSFVTEDDVEIDASRPFEVLKLLVRHRVDINDFFDASNPTTSSLTGMLYQMYKTRTVEVDRVGGVVTLEQKYRKCAHDLCELIMRHIL